MKKTQKAIYLKNSLKPMIIHIDHSWRTATIFSEEESLKNEKRKTCLRRIDLQSNDKA